MRRRRWFRRRHLVVPAVVFIGAYLFWGGHPSRPFEPVDRVIDRAVAATGLVIARTEIAGLRHANAGRIYDIVDATGAQTLFGLRPAALRTAIVAARPWVRDVEIIRDWPDRLRLVIYEREPFAVLHQTRDGKPYAVLIDATGARLSPVPAHAPPPLPQIFGANAAVAAARVVAEVETHPEIAADVVAFEFVGSRRWTLHLRQGRHVHLPASGEAIALAQLAKQLHRGDVATAKVIDLRRPGTIGLHNGGPPVSQARALGSPVADRRS